MMVILINQQHYNNLLFHDVFEPNKIYLFSIIFQYRFYLFILFAQAKLAPALLWVSEDERYYLSDFIESDLIE